MDLLQKLQNSVVGVLPGQPCTCDLAIGPRYKVLWIKGTVCRATGNGQTAPTLGDIIGLTLGALATTTRSVGGASAPGLSKSHISSSLKERRAAITKSQRAWIEFYAGASLLRVTFEKGEMQSKPPPRGKIKGFTEASRRCLMDLMATIDASIIPFFVTLTYPDDFPTYSEEFKRDLDTLGQRLRRRWPECFILWKLEFKARKSGVNAGKVAPHYHLFLYGVPWEFRFKREARTHFSLKQESPGEDAPWTEVLKLDGGQEFVRLTTTDYDRTNGKPDGGLDTLKHWMSRNWFDIVGSMDRKHFDAGTRVERLRTMRGAFYYASKNYVGKPVDCADLEHKPGRFWGVIGRSQLKQGRHEVHAVAPQQAFILRRTIRRHRRANTAPKKRKFLREDQFSIKLYCHADSWVSRLPGLIGPYGESAPLLDKAPERARPKRPRRMEASRPASQHAKESSKLQEAVSAALAAMNEAAKARRASCWIEWSTKDD